MGAKEFERPFSMRGLTTKLKTPHGSMFITINFWEGQIKEVFVVVSKPGSEVRACAEALGRVISLALQKGIPAEDIAETLENIKTEEVVWNKTQDGKSFTVSSIPDAIAKAIRFCLSLKHSPDALLHPTKPQKENKEKKNNSKNKPDKEIQASAEKENNPQDKKAKFSGELGICPECHSSSVVFQEGCYTCMNCGYTKCS